MHDSARPLFAPLVMRGRYAASLKRSGGVKVERRAQPAQGVRFSINRDDREVARAYLYVMTNDLHDAPFGLLEDVFVSESERGSGLGTLLVKEVVAAAREAGCYKLVATSRASRPKVHALYERLGFTNYGVEFRMNLDAADADEHRITIATAGQIANLKPQGS